MKRKITAVLLCVALLLTVAVNAAAVTSSDEIQPITDTQVTPVTNETTVVVSEIDTELITEPITPIDGGVTVTAAATPIGHLDTVSSSIIGGWAYQSDVPNTALTVHIYIINNSTGEQKIIGVTANGYRSDLAAAGYGNGYHAFQYNMSWLNYAPGTYTVRAYAIGVNSSNPQLYSSPKTFTVRNSTGNVEYLNSSGIGGWAWKPDAPNSAIDVHIYIYKSDGTVATTYTAVANQARSDLAAAGYGNGNHGFSKTIDWSSLPEERLRVVVYSVDGSGYNPSFYSGYYENRMPITLLGMVDGEGIDHSTWMWNDSVVTHCQNIGCSQLNRYSCADATDNNYSYSRFIRESSYCAIATHGCKTGIQWSMKNIYHGHDDCDDTCTTCFGIYDTTILNALPNDYFADTRCVVSIACETAQGGKTDATNFVNVLKSKGVETVVGFEEKTWFFYNKTTLKTITTKGSFKWLIEFTRLLGEGYKVDYSAAKAYEETLYINLAAAGYTIEQYKSGDIPEDVLIKEIICGLDSYCVVGTGGQVIKH